MKKLSLFFLVFILFSCVQDSLYKTVDKSYILHDYSSKVWLLDKIIKKGKDTLPFSIKYKKIWVFHQNSNCVSYKMDDLEENRGKKYYFQLSENNKYLTLQSRKSSLSFKVNRLTEGKMILSYKDKKEVVKFVLISFPEI